jgi:WD40 repeat protein
MAQGHGHSEDVAALRWSPDEKQVLSVGDDCCICVWNFYGEA